MASPPAKPERQEVSVPVLPPTPAPVAATPALTRPSVRATPRRITLEIAPDLQDGAFRHRYVPPIVVWGGLVVGAVLLFLLTSWFFDYTRGEVRAMAEVVDRLALPANSCPTCEKQFRIVGLRAQSYYDAPSDRLDLLDPDQAAESTRRVEELRQEVRKFKAWSAEQREGQAEEEEARLRELGY